MNMKMRTLLLTFIACIFLFSCQNQEGKKKTENDGENENVPSKVINNPSSAQDKDEETQEGTTGLPAFKFETETHNFGNVVEGEKVSYAFKFKNVGDAPLVISHASASCGCTIPSYSEKPVPAGGDGVIQVEFNSEGRPGEFQKTITILANTKPNTHKLYIEGEVRK